MENDDLVWLVGKIQYWRVMNPVLFIVDISQRRVGELSPFSF